MSLQLARQLILVVRLPFVRNLSGGRGCRLKKSHIRSLAEMFFVDLPMKSTIGSLPGQVWPPP